MEIRIPEIKKTVYDYEFLFNSGLNLQLTIDPDAGDTIEYLKGIVHVHLAPKTNLTDPSSSQSAEDHTIFLRHVVSTLKKERFVVEMTKEQKEAWRQVYQEVSKSVN
jgi:hypothetical protein